ncbi:Aspartyl/Asparaginyl beta-hydroxylase [Hyella patelloides LEGE 07179]|uniref:Aspartyl/Asparaginyl beta-hydroxylase n=1 Tax=Hyella patelloides LEGE 07179 TaxID=945734 RepID=A0A563W0K1_9CYAN|nr:aspartyl/asparaginyl beta-hydroxylase domain-containing protein [Hyella patelloides]VEP17147.1 Aspartyl/Asparaginyl beta-hydroxylase [Hyella patelloides LEGE 07179]
MSVKELPINIPTSIRNFIIYKVGFNLIQKYEQLISKYSDIGDSPFFEAEQFPWTTELESNWHLIRQELDKILEYTTQLPNFQDISPDQSYSTTKDNLWKTYFLYGYGLKEESNCQRCPETTRLIENIPGMKTAFFSILLPGKHIPEHRGPYKGVVRCLLGLKIPEPKELCGIRVANETRHWEEGKAMFLDDSFPHEAWNDTDDIRVVLFLDIVRPMRFPFSWLNHLLLQLITISPFVQDAKANQKKWDSKLEKLFNQ